MQTIVYSIVNTQHEPHKKPGVNSGTPEGLAVPDIILFLNVVSYILTTETLVYGRLNMITFLYAIFCPKIFSFKICTMQTIVYSYNK
jgi:hypothetical protein